MHYALVVKNLDETIGDFDGMSSRALHPRPLFERLVGEVIESEKTVWKRDGGGGRAHWQPDAKSTSQEKARKGQDHRVMRATGRLERSMTVKGASGQIEKFKPSSVEFGSKVFYGQFHQLAKNKDRRRVFLKILPKNKKNIRTEILDHLTGGFGSGS